MGALAGLLGSKPLFGPSRLTGLGSHTRASSTGPPTQCRAPGVVLHSRAAPRRRTETRRKHGRTLRGPHRGGGRDRGAVPAHRRHGPRVRRPQPSKSKLIVTVHQHGTKGASAITWVCLEEGDPTFGPGKKNRQMAPDQMRRPHKRGAGREQADQIPLSEYPDAGHRKDFDIASLKRSIGKSDRDIANRQSRVATRKVVDDEGPAARQRRQVPADISVMPISIGDIAITGSTCIFWIRPARSSVLRSGFGARSLVPRKRGRPRSPTD